MLLCAAYTQNLNPIGLRWPDLPGGKVLSTIAAALPVLVLFYLLVPRRWLASAAGAGGAAVAVLVAWLVFDMPLHMAGMSFVSGAAFGLLPVGWTIFCAMLLYNITVETGQFEIVRRSVAGISGDARIQAILIGFSFGAFLEGAAGGGTPVAICGAIMVGLGFHPFQAAVLCLIANTSPVAYGGLGTPIVTLQGVTDIPGERLSVMAGHQLPLLSCIVPLYMVKCMCTWRKTLEVWPALAMAGGSFAIFQYFFATSHLYTNLILYPMTDIGGGIFSLVVTAIFLRYWKPRQEWHLEKPLTVAASSGGPERPLTIKAIVWAWLPFALMSVFLMVIGLVRQMESREVVRLGPLQTNYQVPMPWLDEKTYRDSRLQLIRSEQAVAVSLASVDPLSAVVNVPLSIKLAPKPEKARFNFAWLTAPGTPVMIAALVSMLIFRMSRAQIGTVFRRTFVQMKIPIPTIACMLGLSYVTRYAGMDATLGVAFAETGVLYPFFAAILGWLGVFLTGTDAGSNALFGSLQKITATEVFKTGAFSGGGLSLDQAQTLICTANSTGGVMGKMIDAQSICVATAATHQLGKEADIFKAVLWHSIILASIVGLMTLLQAYAPPFTRMVP